MSLERAQRLANHVLEGFRERSSVILIAPTGYGKTLASIKIYEKAVEENIALGLIHVAPFRALVRQIFEEKFVRNMNPSEVGYQSHERISEGFKSAYFLKPLVVTTLDSYMLNLFKLPPAEVGKVIAGKSRGHYMPSLASIFSYVNVFDEGHLYLSEEGGEISWPFMKTSIRVLSHMRVPLLIATATMSSRNIKELVDIIGRDRTKILYICGKTCPDQANNLKNMFQDIVKIIDDRDFPTRRILWITELRKENDALKEVINVILNSGSEEEAGIRTILIVRNTVKNAVETYDFLTKQLTDRGFKGEVLLIHGLQSEQTRKHQYEKFQKLKNEGKPVILVSTQTVEAGVDVDAQILVTDPAPIENLAQRAGRLCRNSDCNRGARVIVIYDEERVEDLKGPYDGEKVKLSMEKLKKALEERKYIEWRLLEKPDNGICFVDLIEEVDRGIGRIGGDYHQIPIPRILDRVLEVYVDSLTSDPQKLVELLDRLSIDMGMGPARSMLKAAILVEGGSVKDYIILDHIRAFKALSRGCLELLGEGLKGLVITYFPTINLIECEMDKLKKIIGGERITMKQIAQSIEDDVRSCINKLEGKRFWHTIDFYLSVNPECYDKIRGLMIW